jgi:hypothetical protein
MSWRRGGSRGWVGVRSLCGKVEESVKYVLRPANRHPSPRREGSHWSTGKELSNVIAQSPLQFAQKKFASSFIQ